MVVWLYDELWHCPFLLKKQTWLANLSSKDGKTEQETRRYYPACVCIWWNGMEKGPAQPKQTHCVNNGGIFCRLFPCVVRGSTFAVFVSVDRSSTHLSLSLSLSSKKQLQLLTPTPNPNTCSSSNLPTVCKPTILKPESEHTKMVTRLQQGSTNTQSYCQNLLRNQTKKKKTLKKAKQKDQGFQSIPDPPRNQRKEKKRKKKKAWNVCHI